jgi:hypothetical protein
VFLERLVTGAEEVELLIVALAIGRWMVADSLLIDSLTGH